MKKEEFKEAVRQALQRQNENGDKFNVFGECAEISKAYEKTYGKTLNTLDCIDIFVKLIGFEDRDINKAFEAFSNKV